MSNKTACAQTTYSVTQKDLPLSCPMKGMTLWDAHPKVYLDIEATGEAMCEYCSAHYYLADESVDEVKKSK
jgi:uncharacterized Zn-finger protein